jgi:pyruvate/2-oxoglutarate dehydrogenase complex dihydrolipoamide dehydrogenase (E3) component
LASPPCEFLKLTLFPFCQSELEANAVPQRASVTDDGSIDERGLVPSDRAFDSSVKVVRSSAKQITSTEVITESGETIPYEHLILATGSIWNGPLALPEERANAISHLRSFKKQLAAAEHILIVGGGAVGLGESLYFCPRDYFY